MGSATKTIVLVGAVLLGIIVVAAGLFIYNTAMNDTNVALNQYPTHEINAFNSQFEVYKGKQKGSGVSALIRKMIVSANNVKDNLDKIPALTIADQIDNKGSKVKNVDRPASSGSTEINKYISSLNSLVNLVENNHEYTVDLEYSTSGFISEFVIHY